MRGGSRYPWNQPTQDRLANVTDGDSAMGEASETAIPVVDYRTVDAPAALTTSLHETGFALLANPPIDQDLIDRVHSECTGEFLAVC